MDLLKENCICKNTRTAPLRYKERIIHTPLPDTDYVSQSKTVKQLNKPKVVKDEDVFDFGKIKQKTKKTLENNDKRFKVKSSVSKKNTPKFAKKY